MQDTAFIRSTSDNGVWGEDEEVFHNSSMYLNNAFPVTTAVCGELYTNYHEVDECCLFTDPL